MPDQQTWAEVALSTLVAAPAVPDMATQKRCDDCGRVSAASDLRHTVADRFITARQMLWVAVAVCSAWLFMRLFSR